MLWINISIHRCFYMIIFIKEIRYCKYSLISESKYIWVVALIWYIVYINGRMYKKVQQMFIAIVKPKS